MAQYTYQSMDRYGEMNLGTLEAGSLSAAAQTIRARGHVVLNIAPEKKKQAATAAKKSLRFQLRSVRKREVAEFCRRLATLLKAGVGVVEGLETMAEAQVRGPFKPIMLEMAQRIRSGFSLSDAIAEQGKTFPTVAASMVSAAEASGELPAILLRIAEHIEKRLQVRESILMALLYPSIVLGLTCVVLVLMLTWVFPTIEKFLHSQQMTLPPLAEGLLSVTAFASSYGAILVGGVAALALGVLITLRTRKGQLFFHRLFLKLPILGMIFRAAATQIWTRTLGDLLKSGLSLQESLKVTAHVVPNRHISGLIHESRDRVVAGTSFGEALNETSPLFDHMVCKLVKVGESSGTLEDALEDIACFAEDDLKRRVTILSKLFEPAVIVFVGLAVGVVFIACFQAIYGYLPSH